MTAERHAEVSAIVHDVLTQAVLADDDRKLDEFEEATIDIAARALATMLIARSYMTRCGSLNERQADAYCSAVQVSNGCLRALKIANPYLEAVH